MNLQLPAERHGIHSRGVGKAAGLHPSIDEAARGAFLSLTIDEAMALINKMVSTQS